MVARRYIDMDIAIDLYISVYTDTHIYTMIRGLSFIRCTIAEAESIVRFEIER